MRYPGITIVVRLAELREQVTEPATVATAGETSGGVLDPMHVLGRQR
ncbi:hypothetical protein [Nocardia sp. NPDC051750]